MKQVKALLVLALLALLGGCAQPPAEGPKANGAYLVIDGREAWAVLVADGKRVEEHGIVRDAIRVPRSRSAMVASYVIDTPNCGRLQTLTEVHDDGTGATRLLSVGEEGGDLSACRIRDDLSRGLDGAGLFRLSPSFFTKFSRAWGDGRHIAKGLAPQ